MIKYSIYLYTSIPKILLSKDKMNNFSDTSAVIDEHNLFGKFGRIKGDNSQFKISNVQKRESVAWISSKRYQTSE